MELALSDSVQAMKHISSIFNMCFFVAGSFKASFPLSNFSF